MAYKNYKQRMAIENKYKKKLLEIDSTLDNDSGIYFLTREDSSGFKYAYIGQAKHILTRLTQHFMGYQHIDLSLKKHGLYSEDNPEGWKVDHKKYPESELDDMEKYYIKEYADKGFQLRNKTAGGQGSGKTEIDDRRPAKGYRDGLIQGRKNASREIARLFEKHLNYSKKSDKPNKNQEKALIKFEEFLNYYKEEKDA